MWRARRRDAYPVARAATLAGGVPGRHEQEAVALARRSLPRLIVDEHHVRRGPAKVLHQRLYGVVLLPARRDALLRGYRFLYRVIVQGFYPEDCESTPPAAS